ncbi:X-ray repair cross-complementing protein 5, partial [Habropoda laboriosa]
QESLVMLINIGVTCPNTQNNPSLLEKAKHIAKRKIEKMIFFRPKDEVAVLLMGSSITKNSLNTEHVEEFADFQIPNWALIEQLMALQGTKHCSNWVEALYAGVEFMKKNVVDVSMRKVILMSDFKEEGDIISQFQADKIAKRLTTEKIELITIAEKSLDERPASSLEISESLLKVLHKKIGGEHITFDNAISELRFYMKAPTKPSPFYFTLELVDKEIPIVSYIKIDESKFPSWQMAKGNQKVVTKTQYFDRQRNLYEEDKIVAGYKYGETFIPVEKELKESMSYKSGEKCYRIHSFTHRNNIHLEYMYGSAHIILPSNREKNVAQSFYSLVQALHETNSVAVARKVYRNNCAPRMVALFPCIDIPDEPWCLVEIALAFAEDRRIMEASPIKSAIKKLTSEQNEAVDNLIDSLLVSDTEDSYEIDDGSQYFLPGCVPDPAVQHKWHMLSYRAINPDKPLPPMEDYLKEIFEVPSIKDRSKCHLQKIAQLFQLESIDPKAEQKDEIKKKGVNMQVDDNIEIKNPLNIENKGDIENESSQEFLSLDTSDIDLEELV